MKRTPIAYRRLDLLPYVLAVLGMYQFCIGDGTICDEVGGFIAQKIRRSLTDEFHGPLFVVTASVDKAGKGVQKPEGGNGRVIG